MEPSNIFLPQNNEQKLKREKKYVILETKIDSLKTDLINIAGTMK
jgi:hypothetical protein